MACHILIKNNHSRLSCICIFFYFCITSMSIIIIIQEQPEILGNQKAFKRVIDSFVSDSIATNRTKCNEFEISDLMDGTKIKLEITPIINTVLVCIGVQVQLRSGKKLSHRFDSCLPGRSYFVLVDCKQLIGFAIEDNKVSIVLVSLYILSASVYFMSSYCLCTCRYSLSHSLFIYLYLYINIYILSSSLLLSSSCSLVFS